MWPFTSNKKKSLEKRFRQFTEEAMRIQRTGDLKAYAAKIEEANEVERQLKELIKE